MITHLRGINSVLYESRYCNQSEFNVVICGGFNKNKPTNEVVKLKGPDFKTSIKMSRMLTARKLCRTAVIGSDILVLGGYDKKRNWSSTFEMYSAKKKCWKELKTTCYHLTKFSVCSFMKSIYVIGGSTGHYFDESDCAFHDYYENYCYKYEGRIKKWAVIASLLTERSNTACF